MDEELDEKDVQSVLNELVENGELHLLVRDGEPYYVANTFLAGYRFAKAEGTGKED